MALLFMLVGQFPKASRRVYRACHFSTAGHGPWVRAARSQMRPADGEAGERQSRRLGGAPRPLPPPRPGCPCLTRKHLAPAARDGGQVLHQVLAAGGLATAAAAQQDDGLVLTAHQHCPVCRLGHGVDVGCHVLPPTPLEHVHHLGQEREALNSAPGPRLSAVLPQGRSGTLRLGPSWKRRHLPTPGLHYE